MFYNCNRMFYNYNILYLENTFYYYHREQNEALDRDVGDKENAHVGLLREKKRKNERNILRFNILILRDVGDKENAHVGLLRGKQIRKL